LIDFFDKLSKNSNAEIVVPVLKRKNKEKK